MNDRIAEGRQRILTCLDEVGGADEEIRLLDLQRAYQREYGAYLNKEELRKFFSKTHLKTVLDTYMGKDVAMSTDIDQTGSMYLMLKRPLEEALMEKPQPSRSTVSTNKEVKNANLVPLPPTKQKFVLNEKEVMSAKPRLQPVLNRFVAPPSKRKETVPPVSNKDFWAGSEVDDSDDNKAAKGNQTSNPRRYVEANALLDDEQDDELGLDYNSVGEQQEEEEEYEEEEEEEGDEDDEPQFGDEALEANNQLLLGANNQLSKKKEQHISKSQTNSIRNGCHSDKYKREIMKNRREQPPPPQAAEEEYSQDEEDDEELRDVRIARKIRASLEQKRQQSARQQSVKADYPKPAPRAQAKRVVSCSQSNLMESSDEEEEAVVMTVAGNEGGDKKGESSTGEEYRDPSAEQFYEIQMAVNSEGPTNVAAVAETVPQLPKDVCNLLVALVCIKVWSKKAIMANKLHSKLAKDSELPYAVHIKSAADLVKFVERHCTKTTQVQKVAGGNYMLLHKEDAAQQRDKIYTLLQKFGKSLDH